MLLAQISDLHVMPKGRRAYERVDTAGMLREAIAHLNRLDPQPDVVRSERHFNIARVSLTIFSSPALGATWPRMTS